MSEEDIKKLKKSKASFKAKLTQFESYLNTATSYDVLSDFHCTELECRLSRIENLIDDFDVLQSKLESLCDPPDEQYADRQQFENQYFKLVCTARQLLAASTGKVAGQRRRSDSVASSNENSGGTCHTKRFNLPKINIPIFNGSYQHWLEFKYTFCSMIHDNSEIDNISKFHYLRASLQGSAAIIVKNIDFTNDNYDIAWTALCERYDNSRLLVNNHIQALFNVSPITKESSRSLRYLVDVTNKNIRALTTLKQPTQHWDSLIIYMMSTKLDAVTNCKWEEHRNNTSVPPTLTEFCSFLRNRADLLESLEENKGNRSEQARSKSFVVVSGTQHNPLNQNKNNPCPMCKGSHTLYNCSEFRGLSIENRVAKAKQLKVCLNCLRLGHANSRCQAPHCRYCRYKHNTMLHLESRDAPNSNDYTPSQVSESVALPADSTPNEYESSDSVALSTNTSQPATGPQILLSTALARVHDARGNAHTARLLLDNGSTANFVTEELCGKLGLSRRSTRSMVSGICNQSSKSTQSCNLTLQSFYSDYKINIDCLILDKITKVLPSKLIQTEHIPIPSGIQLADPTFNVPNGIDILVGAEVFWSVIGNNSIDLGKRQPKLYETMLGWLISGYVAHASTSPHHCHFAQQDDRDTDMSRFWELDSIPSQYSLSPEERACEESFQENTYRNAEGRFVVTMPLKKDPSELGDSYTMAKTRFLSLERRFHKDPNFRDRYIEFMKEYEQLGHMTQNPSPCSKKEISYYLPHHGVLRESSTTTKLRTVFDASAITTSGQSLNNLQMVGPTVQADLMSILIRFRQHKYIVSADIEKMYRAIEINPIQRPLQQIIFRFDPTEPLRTYTLNTLTYGTASAPYLATKCLTSLADTVDDNDVKMSIKQDFYVDDYLGGGDSKEEIIRKCKGVIAALTSAKFNLRKFQSNNRDILKEICGDTLNINNVLQLQDSQNNTPKTLGLNWLCDSDTLTFSISLPPLKGKLNKVTKRHILSVINKIFDPLGLLGPVLVEAKVVMQSLWKAGVSWDTEVPLCIELQWTSFEDQLPLLKDLKIPRRVLQDNYERVELHTFCDSSERAYGACVYARSIAPDGTVYVHLIASKNKIAPIKPTSIPRLELCASLLGTRLCAKILKSITLQVDCRFWSDSTVVLCWLSMPTQQLKPFVRNRVNEIVETTAGSPWSSVPCPQIAENANLSLLQRHKRVDAIKQHFWRRFANDYICNIQQRTKWNTHTNSLKKDTLVLVKDKTTPPLLWTLGRISRTYPGPDGISRVADIKTKKGTIRRGWNNICPLPMDVD